MSGARVSNRLDGKVAVITGAASGIGRASALRFAAEGAHVVVADLDDAGGTALAGEIGGLFVHADVTDADDVQEMYATAVERFGGLDVAFANAGIFGDVARVVDYPDDVFERVLAVNVRGPFHVAKHALAVMRPHGSLIFNSSVVGLTSDPGICAYATSKHALVGDAHRREGGRRPRHPRELDSPRPGGQRLPAAHRDRRHRRGRRQRGKDLRADDPARPSRDRRGDRAGGAVPGRRREQFRHRRYARRRRGNERLALGFPKMGARMPDEERQDFPLVGARARQFKRFERDLADWLETAEGRFALWYARSMIDAGDYAQSAQSPRTTT
jgi:hypothetical protein